MLTITHTWACDVCGREHTERQKTHTGLGWEAPRYADLPHGWSWVSGTMICDKHEIRWTDSEKVTHPTPEQAKQLKADIIVNMERRWRGESS